MENTRKRSYYYVLTVFLGTFMMFLGTQSSAGFSIVVNSLKSTYNLTGEVKNQLNHIAIYPASHYIVPKEKMEKAILEIERECDEREKYFKDNGKFIEAQRISERTRYDVEMMNEVGFCKGIENYSRILSGREPGSCPTTLLDYFPDDFVMFIDESHVTLPQVRAMSGGDRSRKENLINYGFRLPSAIDNRPLTFDEFQGKLNQVVYVSATPGEFERSRSTQLVEQVIRPTGLLDPEIFVRPIEGQIDDLMGEINEKIRMGQRALVTTLTKKMAEALLKDGKTYASGIFSEKTGKTYDAYIVLEDDGTKTAYRLEFERGKASGKQYS